MSLAQHMVLCDPPTPTYMEQLPKEEACLHPLPLSPGQLLASRVSMVVWLLRVARG